MLDGLRQASLFCYPARRMRNSTARVVVAALLVLTVAAAGVFLWNLEQRGGNDAAAALDRRLQPLFETLGEIDAAQARYVEGDAALSFPDAVQPALHGITSNTAELSATLRAPGSADALQRLADATAELAQADSRARDHLFAGDPLGVSAVLLREAFPAQRAAQLALEDLRAAELAVYAADRDARVRRAFTGLGILGLLWVAGICALAPLPRRRPEDSGETALHVTPAPPSVPDSERLDLAAAASLCTDIARVETADALAAMLDRAVALLQAHGVIVWVGAGEELFPVIARGYDATAVNRMGTVPLRGDNATAAAWRTQQLQIVHGGEESAAAVVAPVCAPTGCVAVLAVELPAGREADPSIRAVVTMFAAQLSSLVAGWPTRSN